MRITVQNGANHGLSRREAELVVDALPASLKRVAKSLLFCGKVKPEVEVAYYPKAHEISLGWPGTEDSLPTKSQAISELLVAPSIIAETGSLPERVNQSLRLCHLDVIRALNQKCLALLSDRRSSVPPSP